MFDKCVLVVDDDDTIRHLLIQALTVGGYAPTAVASAEEAVEAFDQQSFGVAIIDKNMPGVDGLETLRRLRAKQPFCRCMIYTGFPSQDSAVEALRYGAFDYLEKPLDVDLILAKVEKAWEGYVLAFDREQIFRKYEVLFEIVPGIVWFMTEQGVLTRINEEGAAMLGYDTYDLLGQPYNVLLDLDQEGATSWTFRERRTGVRATRRQVVTLKTKYGEKRLFEISSTGAYDRSPRDPDEHFWGTLGVGWDITEQSQMEQQLQQARKMEAVGRLAGGIAHDFNNLLMVIINNAAFVRDELVEGDPCLQDVASIENAAEQAAALTRQLLAFSRRQVVKLEPVALGAVMSQLEPMLRRLIRESITLSVECGPELPVIRADSGQIEQVIINLVVNARDAMPNGGSLHISVTKVDVDLALAQSCLNLKPGPHVVLTVRDSGVGMTEDVLERMFEPFYTTKKAGEGTGLGMATVYGIVNQGAGHIDVTSEPGAGTTVKVYLPAAQRAEDRPHGVQVLDARPGKESILVVEDEPRVRSMTRRMLVRNGYRVVEAENGHEALDLYARTEPPVDLILTDVVMPEMGGVEMVSRLREGSDNVPVLMMSGYLGEGALSSEGLGDATLFLQKPFTQNTLLGCVRELLDRYRPTRGSKRP